MFPMSAMALWMLKRKEWNIFENAFKRVNVNKSKLMRYASRRNRKHQVEQIINAIDHD